MLFHSLGKFTPSVVERLSRFFVLLFLILSFSFFFTSAAQAQTWQEVLNQRTQRSKTYQDTTNPNKYSWDGTLAPLHYESSLGSGNYNTQIDMTPVRVNNAQLDGWKVTQAGWHYALGKPGDKTTDGWVGFGGRQGQNWFKFRLARTGYLHWPTRAWQDIGGAPTYNRANLSSQINSLTLGPNNDQIPVETVATWSNLWTTPGGGNLSVSWRANGEQLKEEITLNQAGRNWIAANRPPTTPLTETWFGFVFQLDWSDIPKVIRAGIQQNIEGDFADDNENIQLKDSLDRLLAFMPLDNVKVPNADPALEETQPLRKRFWKDADGNYYLLVGIRADTLNSMAAGDLVFDPTLDLQVGASGDDGRGKATFSFTATTGYMGNVAAAWETWARWIGITLAGTINASYIEYYAHSNGTGTALLKIYGVDEDNPAAPTTQEEFTADPLTTNAVDWDGAWIIDTWAQSPSLNAILQELVDTYTISNEAIMLQVKNDGGGANNFNVGRQWDYASSFGAKLHIEYTSNQNPSAPSSLGPTSLVDGSWGSDNTPTPTFTLSDSDGADTVKYQIQIDDSSDFSSAVVDYTSALAAQGATSFTVGQAAGSGTYTTGTAGQTLADGSYYWRVKAIDNSAAASAYSTANSGAIAFKVDATAPSVPGTPSTTTPTSDNTPTWTWTASTDASSGLHATTPYSVQWCTDSNFTGCAANTATSTTNSYTHSVSLADGTWYLRVKAMDAVSNESSYSSNGSVVVDATSPSSIDLDSPGDNSYSNSERPTFKWKATTDATAGLSKYVLEIDNPSAGSGPASGDFTVDDIPTSRTTDYEKNKYLIHYENFSDSDSTNNYISVYTKSSSEWSTDSNSGQNDGKLREGKVSWKVKARDNAGNETSSSRTLFVDRTNPNVEFTQINNLSTSEESKATSEVTGTGSSDGVRSYSTTDKTPTIFGKITDPLSGADNNGQTKQDENGPKVASGPKQVEIKVEKKEGLLYKLHTLYTINMDKPYYTCDNKEVSDNSKQKCDKYLPFGYTQKEELGLGTYKITLSGKDKADNSSSETTLTLNITTLAEITTPEEKKIIEEALRPAQGEKQLTPEEKKEIQEKLEITKPTEPPKPNIFEKAGENITQAGKNVIQGTGNLITTVFTGIGKGIGFTSSVIASGSEAISKPIKIATSAIGNGLLAMTNSVGQGLAFVGNGVGTGLSNTGHAIGSGLAYLGQGIGTTFSNTTSAIGQEYSNLANNAPGATKNILIAVGSNTTGNAIGTLANNTRQGISNSGNAIANGTSGVVTTTTTIAKNTGLVIASATQKGVDTAKEGVAKTAFFVGEKTQGISDSVAVAFLRVGYSLLTEPTRISNVEAVVLSPTSVKVSWQTNHPANGKVNYGFNDGDYPFEAQTDKRTTYREFTLTNLKPDTEYHYEVMSQNKNYVYDANRTFKTPAVAGYSK